MKPYLVCPPIPVTRFSTPTDLIPGEFRENRRLSWGRAFWAEIAGSAVDCGLDMPDLADWADSGLWLSFLVTKPTDLIARPSFTLCFTGELAALSLFIWSRTKLLAP